MLLIFSLWSTAPYIDLPYQIWGWIGWLLFLLAMIVGIKRFWQPLKQHSTHWWLIAALLFVMTPITTSFLGLGFPAGSSLTVPEMPIDIGTLAVMIFSAFPWVLAAGLLGPIPAVGLALFAGLTRAVGETHNLYTIIEFGLLGLIFSWCVNQPYRSKIFGFLRHPIGAFILTAILYVPLIMVMSLASTNGGLAVRLDYAITQTFPLMMGRSVELFLAAVVAELMMLIGRFGWIKHGKLFPSPIETSLMVRFYFYTFPVLLVVVLGLMVGDWLVAGDTARQFLRQKLASTALIATESLPHFLESGQNLIRKYAERPFVDLSTDKVNSELEYRAREVPFFQQLMLVDLNGRLMGGYPSETINKTHLTQEERNGIQLASRGVMVQTYAIPGVSGGNTARIVFIIPVRDNTQQIIAVLLGYSDLSNNPYTQAAIHALDANAIDSNGKAQIVDEHNRILYSSDPGQVMTEYGGTLPDVDGAFIDNISTMGTRQFLYFAKVAGPPWSIVISVPASKAQELALTTASPLLIMLLVLFFAIMSVWQLLLRFLTNSLRTLAKEASLISQGKLDHSMQVQGADEVGQLGYEFEIMRLSLKARLDELSRLLAVSQGVASNLEAEDSIRPILEAAMRNGAALARVVLVREVVLNAAPPQRVVSFGSGRSSETYAYLDEQIFDLMTGQDILTIPSTVRMRRLTFSNEAQSPGAIIAMALRHESIYFGTFWVAYHTPRNFSDEEVRYLSTLAAQAALAASNAKLYATAEIGRQRMEAVLASTPEPVLVIDEQFRLLLFNPAALKVPGLLLSPVTGRPINEAIANPELLEMISSPSHERLLTREIVLPGNYFYLVSVSPVAAENRPVGKVCLMRDISRYKELDIMKTEFVQMVSHNLRQPLTLMKGYVTMLEMVGSLNLQQKDYVKNITVGVDNMNRLVNNLLNLGRIESGVALQLEKTSGDKIMEMVAHSLQPLAEQKGIKLVYFPSDADIPEIEVDVALLQEALYNLVENAIKYTPVNGSVRLGLASRPNSVIFEVKDTGMGIAPLDQQKLFETFYRSARREVHQQKGSGLGLAIVKSVAVKHHGDVWVESQLGKGSSFYLNVPFRQPKNRENVTV